MKERIASVKRETKETKIEITLNLDGKGSGRIDTGIGFFDHMLEGFARHGFFNLDVKVCGDLLVDCHHTVEDTGIVLGEAIRQAVGDKMGIRRYGHMLLPMDETLMACALDLCGRPYLIHDVRYTAERIGTLDTEMFHEFFYAVSYRAGMNLHFKQMTDGGNNHHIAESCFKAFAKALDMAVSYDPRITEVLSTKGTL